MMTVTQWMSARWPTAKEDQKQQYALLVAQYVDMFQTISRKMIEQINQAKDSDETNTVLTRWVERCDFQAEHLHQSLLTFSGASAGTSWPTKQ